MTMPCTPPDITLVFCKIKRSTACTLSCNASSKKRRCYTKKDLNEVLTVVPFRGAKPVHMSPPATFCVSVHQKRSPNQCLHQPEQLRSERGHLLVLLIQRVKDRLSRTVSMGLVGQQNKA